MLESGSGHAAMRPWPLIGHESFGRVLMLDSYMHACDWRPGTIGLHDPAGCLAHVCRENRMHGSMAPWCPLTMPRTACRHVRTCIRSVEGMAHMCNLKS